jgi:hypothetical protein
MWQYIERLSLRLLMALVRYAGDNPWLIGILISLEMITLSKQWLFYLVEWLHIKNNNKYNIKYIKDRFEWVESRNDNNHQESRGFPLLYSLDPPFSVGSLTSRKWVSLYSYLCFIASCFNQVWTCWILLEVKVGWTLLNSDAIQKIKGSHEM